MEIRGHIIFTRIKVTISVCPDALQVVRSEGIRFSTFFRQLAQTYASIVVKLLHVSV